MSKGSSILEVRDLQVRKGGVLILDIPALQIEEGELLSLIGPNGAGKSTLLQTLASLTKLSAGEIIFKGEDGHRGSWRLCLSPEALHGFSGSAPF